MTVQSLYSGLFVVVNPEDEDCWNECCQKKNATLFEFPAFAQSWIFQHQNPTMRRLFRIIQP